VLIINALFKYFIKKIIMKNIFYFAILLFLASCTEESFQTVVDYEVPLEQKRLVINSEVTAGKDTMVVFLSKSRTSSEAITEAFDTLSKATITLFKEGVKYKDLTFVEKIETLDGDRVVQYLYKYRTLIDKDLALKKYTLKASALGYEDVTSDDVLSPLVPIKTARYEANGFTAIITDLGGKKTKTIEDLIEFEFDDPAGNNFYILQVLIPQTDNQGNVTKRLARFDMNQQFSAGKNGYSGSKAIIPDATFDGKPFKIQIGVSQNGGGKGGPGGGGQKPTEYEIVLRSVSRSTYLFESSLAAYNANNGNPFADATVLYTNVYKGYGLFSMQQRATYKVYP
jgi:hypothetical protein